MEFTFTVLEPFTRSLNTDNGTISATYAKGDKVKGYYVTENDGFKINPVPNKIIVIAEPRTYTVFNEGSKIEKKVLNGFSVNPSLLKNDNLLQTGAIGGAVVSSVLTLFAKKKNFSRNLLVGTVAGAGLSFVFESLVKNRNKPTVDNFQNIGPLTKAPQNLGPLPAVNFNQP